MKPCLDGTSAAEKRAWEAKLIMSLGDASQKRGATMTQSAVAEEPVAKGSLKPVSAQRKKRKNTGGASISEHSIAALGSAISVGGAIDLIQRAPSLLPRALVELWPILTAVALWHVCHKRPIACYLSETRYCA